MEKSRYWFATIHIGNMKKAGLTDEQIANPDYVANYFLNIWKNSAASRTGCIAVCKSAKESYHLHAALYGEKTTLNAVAKLLFDSHVEKCTGGKSAMVDYIQKEGKYAEKGEIILCTVGKENIKVNQGKRRELEDIKDYIMQGMTPNEIFDMNFGYRRYEKMIKAEYLAKRVREAPLRKNMYVEWHVGLAGTGKTHTYIQLCEKIGADNIYLAGYMTNGWLDKYMECGAPPVLFIDEMRPNGSWQELLNVLDEYTRKPIHCRYEDAYPLWDTVHISTIFPPEEMYKQMVKDENRHLDSFYQLLRRIKVITYHFIENGQYKKASIPANQYTNYEDFKQKVHSGLIPSEYVKE